MSSPAMARRRPAWAVVTSAKPSNTTSVPPTSRQAFRACASPSTKAPSSGDQHIAAQDRREPGDRRAEAQQGEADQPGGNGIEETGRHGVANACPGRVGRATLGDGKGSPRDHDRGAEGSQEWPRSETMMRTHLLEDCGDAPKAPACRGASPARALAQARAARQGLCGLRDAASRR